MAVSPRWSMSIAKVNDKSTIRRARLIHSSYHQSDSVSSKPYVVMWHTRIITRVLLCHYRSFTQKSKKCTYQIWTGGNVERWESCSTLEYGVVRILLTCAIRSFVFSEPTKWFQVSLKCPKNASSPNILFEHLLSTSGHYWIIRFCLCSDVFLKLWLRLLSLFLFLTHTSLT